MLAGAADRRLSSGRASSRPTTFARLADPRFALMSMLGATLIFFVALTAFVMTTNEPLLTQQDEVLIQQVSMVRSDLGALLGAAARDAPRDVQEKHLENLARSSAALSVMRPEGITGLNAIKNSAEVTEAIGSARVALRRGDRLAYLDQIDQLWMNADNAIVVVRAQRLAIAEARERLLRSERLTKAFLISGCMVAAAALGFGAARRWRLLTRNREALETAVRERTAETNEARMRAEAENRAKSEFLLRMSHELRTPLNAVIGFSDFMRRPGAASPDKVASYADDIHKAGLHLQGLVDDLLALGRLDVGAMRLALEPAAFNDLTERAAKLAGASMDARLRILPSDVDLLVDRRAMLQILINLVANARRYAVGASFIEIACAAHDDGWATITVHDDGAGMSGEALERALSPLEAVGDPLTAQPGGAQIGLSIVRRLTWSQGGACVFTTAPGEGFKTEITVALAPPPRSDARAEV